jgi:hypothetical protein
MHNLREVDPGRELPGFVRHFSATTTESDFSHPCIIGFGSSPSRCGPVSREIHPNSTGDHMHVLIHVPTRRPLRFEGKVRRAFAGDGRTDR